MNPPVVRIGASGVRGSGKRWTLRWKVRNAGRLPLRIVSARAPHARFRSGEQLLELPTVRPRGHLDIPLAVSFAEPPGTVVENPYLILGVLCGDEPWRVLAKLRVTARRDGAPEVSVQAIAAHRVGFSDAS